MKRHYNRKLAVRRDICASSLAIVGGIYLILSSNSVWVGWLLLIPGAILLLMIGYALFLLPRLIYNSQSKLKQEYTLKFSDAGIAFKTSSIDSNLQWSHYQSWLSDDDFYILYHGARDLSVIPRRAIAKGDDERLRQYFTRMVGPASVIAGASH